MLTRSAVSVIPGPSLFDRIKSMFRGSGVTGAFYDFSRSETLFSDRSGTPATPASVDGVVGTVLDLSGNGYHMIAPSDSARGTLRSDGRRRWIEFDGVNDEYVVNDTSALNFGTTNFYGAFAFKTDLDLLNRVLFAKTDTTTGNNFRFFLRAAPLTNQLGIFRGTDAQPSSTSDLAVVDNVPSVIAFGRDATQDRYRKDGVSNSKSWSNAGVGSTTFNPVFGGDQATSYEIDGDLFGMLVINRFPSDDERNLIDRYFAPLCGLVL